MIKTEKKKCAVISCNNTEDSLKNNERVEFYQFPRKECFQNEWLKAIGKARSELKNIAKEYICEDHFAPNAFIKDSKTSMKKLYYRAKPELNLQHCSTAANTELKMKENVTVMTKELISNINHIFSEEKKINDQFLSLSEVMQQQRMKCIEQSLYHVKLAVRYMMFVDKLEDFMTVFDNNVVTDVVPK